MLVWNRSYSISKLNLVIKVNRAVRKQFTGSRGYNSVSHTQEEKMRLQDDVFLVEEMIKIGQKLRERILNDQK